jgi:hypothetical protein
MPLAGAMVGAVARRTGFGPDGAGHTQPSREQHRRAGTSVSQRPRFGAGGGTRAGRHVASRTGNGGWSRARTSVRARRSTQMPRSQGPADRLARWQRSRFGAAAADSEPVCRPRVRTVRVADRRQTSCLRQVRCLAARGAGTGGVSRHWQRVLRHRWRGAGDQANRAECSGSEEREPRAQARGDRTDGPGADGSMAPPWAASHPRVTGRTGRGRATGCGEPTRAAVDLVSAEALAGEAPRSGERDDANDTRQSNRSVLRGRAAGFGPFHVARSGRVVPRVRGEHQEGTDRREAVRLLERRKL